MKYYSPLRKELIYYRRHYALANAYQRMIEFNKEMNRHQYVTTDEVWDVIHRYLWDGDAIKFNEWWPGSRFEKNGLNSCIRASWYAIFDLITSETLTFRRGICWERSRSVDERAGTLWAQMTISRNEPEGNQATYDDPSVISDRILHLPLQKIRVIQPKTFEDKWRGIESRNLVEML